MARLKQVKGVGTLIALTYVLTLEDPRRFRKSRDVGCYLGLRPGRQKLGAERAAAPHQQGRRSLSKNDDGAGRAPHSGAVRSGQRSATLGSETGRARRKEWEETSGDGGGAKVGRPAASTVGERRNLRAAAQPARVHYRSRVLDPGLEKAGEKSKSNRRVPVTAIIAWPNLPVKDGREVENQVAAPTETRTPNWHRANIAQRRVRMEGWRQ